MNQWVKRATRPVYRALLRPSFRCSSSFVELQQLLSYIPQESVLSTAMDFAGWSQLEGDYLEFGVYQGGRLSSAYHFARRNKLDSMRFYAFDSFRGLPEIGGLDAEGFRQFQRGEYACDQPAFERHIARNGVDRTKVEIVPGWFDEVLNAETKSRLPLQKAAIIWVDCDLYESTVPVLEFVTEYVQDGTVMIFDDWFCFRGSRTRGEQRAFREWLDGNTFLTATEFHKFGWHGNSFVIHRS